MKGLMLNNNYYRRLAVAVLLQAVIDASQGDLEAQEWLFSEGADWLKLIDIEADTEQIRKSTQTTVTRRDIQKMELR